MPAAKPKALCGHCDKTKVLTTSGCRSAPRDCVQRVLRVINPVTITPRRSRMVPRGVIVVVIVGAIQMREAVRVLRADKLPF